MRLLVLASFAGVLGACAVSTDHVENADEIRINYGNGGLVIDTANHYHDLYKTGKRVVIDGPVYSADAFFAFGTPGACYTENAVFAPHAASYLSLIPDYELTAAMAERLPDPLRDYFMNHHGFYDWLGFVAVPFRKLIEIWPEGACPEELTVAVSGPGTHEDAMLRRE